MEGRIAGEGGVQGRAAAAGGSGGGGLCVCARAFASAQMCVLGP